MCELVVARQNASIRIRGAMRLIRKGTVLCASDPLVASHRNLFESLAVEHHCGGPKSGVVEQATAAPGELRAVKPPADTPRRPPTSGPGSGIDAWRRYADQVTELSEDELGELSRDDLINLVS